MMRHPVGEAEVACVQATSRVVGGGLLAKSAARRGAAADAGPVLLLQHYDRCSPATCNCRSRNIETIRSLCP